MDSIGAHGESHASAGLKSLEGEFLVLWLEIDSQR